MSPAVPPHRWSWHLVAAVGLAAAAALALGPWVYGIVLAEGPAAKATPSPADQPRADQSPANGPLEENLYLARPDMTTDELLSFIERMESKPQSIRTRPGFLDAIVDAADRILAATDGAAPRAAALSGKMRALHAKALAGDQESDQALFDLALEHGESADADLQAEARLHLWEQRVLQADSLPADELGDLLEPLKTFMTDTSLDERHLRLASLTVRIINRLPDDAAAQQAYREFGRLWAGSDDSQLAQYGRSVEKASRPQSLVGQALELEGAALDGIPFDWSSYQGKVVLVDFWATWCPPCGAQLPDLLAAYEAYHDRGFEIVGVSLDTDREGLERYVARHRIPWVNLFNGAAGSSGWKHPLAVRYGVRAIPFTLLVDKQGKVIAQDIPAGDLASHLDDAFADGERPQP